MKLTLKPGITLEFFKPNQPINGHLHVYWAEEKCPQCGNPLLVIYIPAIGSYQKMLAELQNGMDHKIFSFCTGCALCGQPHKNGEVDLK